ncbi:MAG: dihydropteroate synthase [Gammaproteobacteria bacterium]|nr:dihydropteroate synthase [Gammaproteobacteria bacterium]
MAILNVTPDSFSDGGRYSDLDAAKRGAEEMAAEGAAVIDIGGESTRPGAAAVSEAEELDRVLTVVEAVIDSCDLPVSIDTTKPGVMRAAVAAGAGVINDINALRTAGAVEVAAELAVPVVLMHMQGSPRTMQDAPLYRDVVADVADFFRQRLTAATAAGVLPTNIILDPGIGFGKSADHNLQLLRELEQFLQFGSPLLVGISRKSIFGTILGRALEERLPGSLAAAAIAVWLGAKLIRTHDTKATLDAVNFSAALRQQ